MTPITLPGSQPNDPLLTNLFMYDSDHEDPVRQLWRNEHISVNDCFLKNIHKYKYIVNIDNDEIILPLNETNWYDMMAVVEQETKNKVFFFTSFYLKKKILFQSIGCWAFQNTYFFDDMTGPGSVPDNVPPGLHMMRHVVRSREYSGHTKCFVNTDTALSLTQHSVATCLEGVSCDKKSVVDPGLAHTQHYRATCPQGVREECQTRYRGQVVTDTRAWTHLQTVVKNTHFALDKIKFT